MKLLQSVFVLLLISEHAFAKSKYCVQVTAAYDFDKNDMKPAVERILKNFDYARIDKRGNQLVLRIGNYEHYSQGVNDLNKVQGTYRDAYIRRCDYDPSRVIFEFKNKSYTVPEEASPAQPAIKLQADPQDELEYKIATGQITPTPKRKIAPQKEIQPEEEISVLEGDKDSDKLNETQKQTPYQSNPSQETKVTPRKRFEYTKNEKYDYVLSNQCSQCFAPIELEPDYKDLKAAALKKEALRKKEQEEKNALKLYKVKNKPLKKFKQEDEDQGFFSFFSSSEKEKKPKEFFKNTNEVTKVQVLKKEPVKLGQNSRLPQPVAQPIQQTQAQVQPAPQAQIQSKPETLPQTSFDEVDDFFNLKTTSTPKQVPTPVSAPTQVTIKKPQPQIVQKAMPQPEVKNTLPDEPTQKSFDEVDDFFNLEPATTPKQVPTPTQTTFVKEQPQQVTHKSTPLPTVENDPIDKILAMPVEETQRVERPKRVKKTFTPRPKVHYVKTQLKNEYNHNGPQKEHDEIIELPKKKKSFFSFFKSDSSEEMKEDTPSNNEENIYGEPTKTVKSGLYDMFDIDDTNKPVDAVQQEDFKEEEKDLAPHYNVQEEEVVPQSTPKQEPIKYREREYSYKEDNSYTQPTKELRQEREEHYNFSKPLKEKKEPKKKMELDTSYDTYKEHQQIMTQSNFEQPIKSKTSTQEESSLDNYSSFAKPLSSDKHRETKRVKKDTDPLDDYEDLDDSYTQVSYTPKYKKRKVQTHNSKEKRRKEEDVLMDEYDDLNNNSDSNSHTKKEKKYDPMSEYEE